MSMINVDSSDGDQMKIDVTDIIPWIVRVTMQMQLLDTNTVEVSNIILENHRTILIFKMFDLFRGILRSTGKES